MNLTRGKKVSLILGPILACGVFFFLAGHPAQAAIDSFTESFDAYVPGDITTQSPFVWDGWGVWDNLGATSSTYNYSWPMSAGSGVISAAQRRIGTTTEPIRFSFSFRFPPGASTTRLAVGIGTSTSMTTAEVERSMYLEIRDYLHPSGVTPGKFVTASKKITGNSSVIANWDYGSTFVLGDTGLWANIDMIFDPATHRLYRVDKTGTWEYLQSVYMSTYPGNIWNNYSIFFYGEHGVLFDDIKVGESILNGTKLDTVGLEGMIGKSTDPGRGAIQVISPELTSKDPTYCLVGKACHFTLYYNENYVGYTIYLVEDDNRDAAAFPYATSTAVDLVLLRQQDLMADGLDIPAETEETDVDYCMIVEDENGTYLATACDYTAAWRLVEEGEFLFGDPSDCGCWTATTSYLDIKCGIQEAGCWLFYPPASIQARLQGNIVRAKYQFPASVVYNIIGYFGTTTMELYGTTSPQLSLGTLLPGRTETLWSASTAPAVAAYYNQYSGIWNTIQDTLKLLIWAGVAYYLINNLLFSNRQASPDEDI